MNIEVSEIDLRAALAHCITLARQNQPQSDADIANNVMAMLRGAASKAYCEARIFGVPGVNYTISEPVGAA